MESLSNQAAPRWPCLHEHWRRTTGLSWTQEVPSQPSPSELPPSQEMQSQPLPSVLPRPSFFTQSPLEASGSRLKRQRQFAAHSNGCSSSPSRFAAARRRRRLPGRALYLPDRLLVHLAPRSPRVFRLPQSGSPFERRARPASLRVPRLEPPLFPHVRLQRAPPGPTATLSEPRPPLPAEYISETYRLYISRCRGA